MKKIFLTIIFYLFPILLLAQSTGFDILNNAAVPAALSRADAGVAYPDGSASIYTNPALLIMMPYNTLDLAYSSWVYDARHVFGGANFIKGKRAAAVSFYSSVSDDFQQRDNPGPSNGNFAITYLSVSGAFAYDLGIFTAGVAGQYLYEEIYTSRATGYAFNFGLAKEFLESKIRTGVSLLNVGEMDKLDFAATPLPQTFRAGFAVDIVELSHPKNPDLPILVSLTADYVMPMEDDLQINDTFVSLENYVNTGIIFNIAETVELTAGYRSGKNTNRPISFGTGIITDYIKFNYAIIPFDTGYGTVHSIGIQYKF